MFCFLKQLLTMVTADTKSRTDYVIPSLDVVVLPLKPYHTEIRQNVRCLHIVIQVLFSELLFCNMTCCHPRHKPFVILIFEHYVSLPQFRSNLFVAVSLPGNSLIYLLYNFGSRTYNTLLAFINKGIVVLVCVLSCYVVGFAFFMLYRTKGWVYQL